MTANEVQTARAPRNLWAAAGATCVGLGLLAAVVVLAVWLFGTDPPVRRLVILVCLGSLACCAVAAAWVQRSYGRRESVDDLAREACVIPSEQGAGTAVDASSLPRVLPSRRGIQLRCLAWVFGLVTALLAFGALTAGAPQRSAPVERIHAAGAAFGVARAEEVRDVRRKPVSRGTDPYLATVVVRLPVGVSGAQGRATVTPTTRRPLSPGDPVDVLYAPTEPRLGAVAGNESILGSHLRGESLPPYLRLLFVAAWILGCAAALSHLSTRLGFRSFSRLGRNDRAVRGYYSRVAGPGALNGRASSEEETYLEIGTDSGWARFHTGLAKQGLPEVMQRQPLWLCWDARRGARMGRFSPCWTPAALVFDTGLVVHGMMRVDGARRLSDTAVALDEPSTAPGTERPLRLFDVRGQWLRSMDPFVPQLCAVVLACAALLTFDVAGGWRWATGLVGALGVIAATGLCASQATAEE